LVATIADSQPFQAAEERSMVGAFFSDLLEPGAGARNVRLRRSSATHLSPVRSTSATSRHVREFFTIPL